MTKNNKKNEQQTVRLFFQKSWQYDFDEITKIDENGDMFRDQPEKEDQVTAKKHQPRRI